MFCSVLSGSLTSTNLSNSPQSITLKTPGLSVVFGGGFLRAYINDQPDLKWKERFVGFAFLKLHRLQRGFCPQVLIVKWGVITCTVSRIQWIPSVTIFVSKSSFLRWVNDDLSSTAVSPEDTKLEQMGNMLVFHNMFRKKSCTQKLK